MQLESKSLHVVPFSYKHHGFDLHIGEGFIFFSSQRSVYFYTNIGRVLISGMVFHTVTVKSRNLKVVGTIFSSAVFSKKKG